jgi:hypothetical protein
LFAPRFVAISCEFARYDIARHENAEEADRSLELHSHLLHFHGHGRNASGSLLMIVPCERRHTAVSRWGPFSQARPSAAFSGNFSLPKSFSRAEFFTFDVAFSCLNYLFEELGCAHK